MAGQPLDEQTCFPADNDEFGNILRFVRANDGLGRDGYRLGRSDTGDQIELPDSVRRALRLVVEAMATGKAVTITPQQRQEVSE